MAQKEKTGKTKVYMVIGLGTFGQRVCEVLATKGGKVIAVDMQAARIERIKDSVTQAVMMDATDEEAFSRIALEDVDIAVVAIGDNIEGSILATALLKQRGVPRIIARAITPIHRQVLVRIGADEVINIEENEGEELAERLIAPDILDTTALSADISIAEVNCPEGFEGKTLVDLDLRTKMNINVVAVKRPHLNIDEEGNSQRRDQLLFPEENLPLDENDTLIVVGYNSDIERLSQV